MIAIRELVKTYGTARAVNGLSFDVAPGELVGLIGPNGAGKTSTLRCIAGIHRPTGGSVSIGGHDIARDPVPAKRLLAFVPDEPHLFEHLTVIEHLRLVGRIYAVADVEARARVLLDEMELAGREKSLPAELSRGMKQKVLLACAFLHDPKALILDEPLTGLDPLGIHRMKQAIVAAAHRGVAVIISSHLLHLVEEICTRIVIIDRGVKAADGTLSDLAAKAREGGTTLEQIFLDVTGPGKTS
jgi:ABC-2 type transport system ATP-binding protein